MRLEDFSYDLPEELIAQSPLDRRDASRLLVADKATGQVQHRRFHELPLLLRRGDLLVVNDTKVIPARLVGRKVGTGGRAELLLVRPAAQVAAADALERPAAAVEWVCLGQASKGLRPGTRVAIAEGFSALVLESIGEGEHRVRLEAEAGTLALALAQAGQVPLPPYVAREPTAVDAARYQTIYARAPGSAAAPTAGLHFTDEVFTALEGRGVERATVTLDVGPGTFLPVRESEVDRHRMHAERYLVPRATAEAVGRAHCEGRRVVAVGTTVVRALESSFLAHGEVRPGAQETSLFIRPGFEFKVAGALLTNFHLPRSTLLMLVCAFLGTDRTLSAYRRAVEGRYRFFSYGDAMLIGDL